ncbi:39S ribosomal protein L28, mitochondrial [Mortierella antarctica]|nr:39S ribosomal protein L28, mitochondrial [Mortierella antarctica]
MSSPFLRTAVTASSSIMRAAGRPGMKKGGSTSLNGDARNDLIKKDMARHETIERAWKLVRQQRKQEHAETMAKKFEMIRKANAELEATSPLLFKHSQTKERNAVFPRQLRTLTDTPPKQIWNYRQAVDTTKA